MKKIQLVLDLEVADDKLTLTQLVNTWKGKPLLPGAVVTAAAAFHIQQPIKITDSLSEWPGVSGRLAKAASRGGINSIKELAAILPDFARYKGVGPGTMKEAVRICSAAGHTIKPHEFDSSTCAYATSLLGATGPAAIQLSVVG